VSDKTYIDGLLKALAIVEAEDNTRNAMVEIMAEIDNGTGD